MDKSDNLPAIYPRESVTADAERLLGHDVGELLAQGNGSSAQPELVKGATVMGAMLVRHEATSASAVRRELALDLDLHDVDADAIDEIVLVASELLGNAIRHGGVKDRDEIDVTWTVGPDEIIFCVEDPSEALPVRRSAGTGAQDGRGLTIIEALASDWGFERTPRGKRVWAKVELRHAS